MKFPLRSNNAVAPVAPSNDNPKVQPNRKPNVNKRDPPGTTVQRPNRTGGQQLAATKQKTKEVSNPKQKKHPFAETVTLTKAQLDAILASVGKLPITDENLANEIYTFEEQPDEIEVTYSKPDPAVSFQDGSHFVQNWEASTKDGYEQTAKRFKDTITQQREEYEKASMANLLSHGGHTNTNQVRIPVPKVQEKAANPYPAPQAMSLAEKKKRQWQKERDEVLQDYDPWGRPGAGAPLLDAKGQVVTNLKAYQSQQGNAAGNVPSEIGQQPNPFLHQSMDLQQPVSANLGEYSYLADTIGQMSRTQGGMEPLESYSVLPGLSAELTGMSFPTQQPPSANHYHHPADIGANKSGRPVAVVPAAMRSSFVIGNNDAPDYESIRVDEKKRWLMELEHQKEEHRLRKVEEKERFHSSTESLPFNPAPSSMTQRSDGSVGQKSSHLRGHLNLHMDPVTQQQLELKKRKNEELMLELQAQINEQQKRKLLEMKKKQLEEAEGEERLQAEQRLLNEQYQHDMLKEKHKMEAKEQKLKQLAATIEHAREEAMLDKKLKRLQYLEQHGHDTSKLQGNLAATCRTVSSCKKSKDAEYADAPTDIIVSCNEDQVLSTGTEGFHNEFSSRSKLRDFASQTDSCLLSKCELSDVEIEYESEEETRYERFAVENVRPSGIKGKKPAKLQDRPSWGYQNPNSKKPVKRNNHLVRQGTEKRILNQNQNQKTGPLVPTNKKEFSSNLYSGSGAAKDPGNTNKPPKQSSVSQRPRLGGQQEKVSRQVKAGHHQQPSIKPDTRRGQEVKVLREKVQRDPSPPVPTLRKKAVRPPPPVEPITDRAPRCVSPPVPALRRKLHGGRQEMDNGELDIQTDTYNYDHMKSVNPQARPVRKTSKYMDNVPRESPVPQNDFIPFTRTCDVLDPANADSPLPISREQSSILRGRQSYWKGQQPADFGDSVEHFNDQPISDHEKPFMKTTLEEASVSEKKALFQQLSALKQKLRQLELETSTSMLEPPLTP